MSQIKTTSRTKTNRHVPPQGSDLEDWLEEEGILEEVTAVAVKRVLAMEIADLLTKNKMSKSALARKMKTSRPTVDRLLDQQNPSVTLETLQKAAFALGKRLRIAFV